MGDRLVASAHLARAKDALVKLVTDFHRAQPLSDGLPREEAREKVSAQAAAVVFERVVDDLKKTKVLVGADRLALAAHTVAGSGEDARIKAAIASVYASAGLKPPDAAVVQASIRGMKATAAGGQATVDVAAFKDRYGISRKFAIPLLEYLDRERVTRRTGDVRLVI